MTIHIEMGGRLRRIDLKAAGGDKYEAALDGAPIEIDARLLRPGVLSLIVAGRVYQCVLEHADGEQAVYIRGQRHLYGVEDPRSLKSRRSHAAGADGPKTLKAPMPGRVLRVLAKTGDQVKEHQGLLVIEAMKMQNELKSPKAGKVTAMNAEPGGTVSAGDVLATIE